MMQRVVTRSPNRSLSTRSRRGTSATLALVGVIAWIVTGCSSPSLDPSAPDAPTALSGLVVNGLTRSFGNETLEITGDVLITGGGSLLLDGTTINIIQGFEEEFVIRLSGDSRLEVRNALIRGVGHQTAIIAESDASGSPTLVFTNSVFTNHAGLRPFGETVVTTTNSDIEEVQVHDRAIVNVTGGEGLYPVFFFEDIDGELADLVAGPRVTRTVSINGGWSLTINDADVDGYQIDAVGDSRVTLLNSEAITASIHTNGELGAGEVLVKDVTTDGRADGDITGLGPSIVYGNTTIELFNIYVEGEDRVRVRGGLVNEANTQDAAKLTIESCTVKYDLVQAYDRSNLIIDGCEIDPPSSTPPSLTAEGDSVIILRDSDVAGLQIQAIENARVELSGVRNLDLDNVAVREEGAVFADGERVR